MARTTTLRFALVAAMVVAAGTARAGSTSCDFAIQTQNQTVSEWVTSGTQPTVWVHGSVTLNATNNWDGYVWTVIAGVGSVQAASQPKQGIYTAGDVTSDATATVQVTASKAGCGQKTATATVRILNVELNHPPVAVATATPSVVDPEGTLVTLDGSGSSDPDGDALTFAWTQVGGPAVTLSDAAAVAPTFTAPDVGLGGASLTFSLTVKDSQGAASAPAEVIVTVTWVDVPPVARLTVNGQACPAQVAEGAAVALDGSTSGDVDDGIAWYAWSEPAAGPVPNPTVDLACPGGPSATTCTFTAPALEQSFADPHMTLKLTVTDAADAATGNAGLDGSATCVVEVLDVTPPVVTVPAAVVAEATGPSGAIVTYPDATGFDAWNGSVPATCTPASGSTFPIDATTEHVTTVDCAAHDAAGNVGTARFTVTVRDTTPPTVTPPADVVAEATGPTGASVSYGAATASDLVDGPGLPATCSPAPGVFAIGDTVVTCSATDRHGNTGTASFTVKVQDTTPPVLTLPADRAVDGQLDPAGEIVTFEASATDVVDGAVTPVCAPASGSKFPFGTTTVTCTATDAHGNKATGSFDVTVRGYKLSGFFAPVDDLPFVNAVKGGATVPVKFRVFTWSGVELTNTAAVDLTRSKAVQTFCGSADPAEDILTTTGGTSLRYDATGAQFVLNWQTPRLSGTCWELDVAFTDGSTKAASFKLK